MPVADYPFDVEGHQVERRGLLTINHGLGTSVLVGQRTSEAAREVLRYHLDRLFD